MRLRSLYAIQTRVTHTHELSTKQTRQLRRALARSASRFCLIGRLVPGSWLCRSRSPHLGGPSGCSSLLGERRQRLSVGLSAFILVSFHSTGLEVQSHETTPLLGLHKGHAAGLESDQSSRPARSIFDVALVVCCLLLATFSIRPPLSMATCSSSVKYSRTIAL